MQNKNDKRQVFLSDNEQAFSLKELQHNFGISRATAWRARERGWFHQNYHTATSEKWMARRKRIKAKREGTYVKPQKPLKPLPRRTRQPESLPWREVVILSDKQRMLTTKEIAILFAIPLRTALDARNRGWFCRIIKTDHTLPDGVLPENTSLEDVVQSAVYGALAASRGRVGTYIARGFMDEIRQEAILKLLHYTAHPAFESFVWRFVIAKYAAREYIRKLYTAAGHEVNSTSTVDDDNELSLVELAERKLASRDPRPKANQLFTDNRVFLSQVRLFVGEDDWARLMHWSEHGTRNQPGDIAVIIRRIREELGLS